MAHEQASPEGVNATTPFQQMNEYVHALLENM
jgi:hypothetical protein